MTDTLWADVSEWNNAADDTYPYHLIAFRANDGTYLDHKFTQNVAYAKRAVATNKLAGFIVYLVWEPNWRETVATFTKAIGTPHPNMAVMIDVESWGKRISGDHSPGINGAREALITWLGSYMTLGQRAKGLHRKRVVGYGNVSDLVTIWPRRGDVKLVVAAYGSNPPFPNKLAHQFSDKYTVAPFGGCDINSADGLSPAQVCAALGLPGVEVIKTPIPVPVPPAPASPSLKSFLDTRLAVLEADILATYGKSP